MKIFTPITAKGRSILSLFSPQKHFQRALRCSLLLAMTLISTISNIAYATDYTDNLTGSTTSGLNITPSSSYNSGTTTSDESGITYSWLTTRLDNKNIQIRTSKKCAIVTTANTKSLTPKSVTITGSAQQGAILVYANTSNYAGTSDMYETSIPGDLINSATGTSVTTSATTIEIPEGDYIAIGIKPATTTIVKISSIVVTWSDGSTSTICSAPTNLTPADGYQFVTGEEINVTADAPTTPEGAQVKYSTDQSEWLDALSINTDDYTDGQTVTVYAKTVDPSGTLADSNPISATYTCISALDGLSALREAIKADNDNTKTYIVKHSKLYVTRGTGNNYYMQDDDCGVLLYKCNVSTGTSYEEGIATVSGCMYNGQVELTSFSTTGTAGEDETEPIEVAFDELYSDLTSGESMYESMLVTVVKATVDADVDFSSKTSGSISQDEQSITIFRRGTVKLSLSADQVIDITGIACPYTYNNKVTPEILLYRASDVTTYAAVELKAQDTDGAYYATYYDDEPYYASEGVITYTMPAACVSDGVLDASRLKSYNTGDIVPAKTAVLLWSTDAGTYYFKHASSTAKAPADNLLHGNDGTAADASGEIQLGEGYLYYMLSYDKQGENLGFYWGAAEGAAFKNGANKAFLAVSKDQAAGAKGITFSNDKTNGIKNIETAAKSDATYTLSGVRMNSNNLPAGIYVRGGKKFIVK